MAQRVEVKVELPIAPKDCLTVMSSPELIKELKDWGGMATREASNRKVEGDIMSWQIDVRFLQSLPSWTKDLIRSEQLKWVQKFRLNLKSYDIQIAVEHPLPAKSLTISGQGRIREIAPDVSSFEVEIDVASQLPLIGKRLETALVERMKAMLQTDLDIRQKYVVANRDKVLGLTQGELESLKQQSEPQGQPPTGPTETAK